MTSLLPPSVDPTTSALLGPESEQIAEVLRIAASIVSSRLNPEYGIQLARDLAAAITPGPDAPVLADIEEHLGVVADAIGLHGINDDQDLYRELMGYCSRLRALSPVQTCPGCGMTWGLLQPGKCLNCGHGIVGDGQTGVRAGGVA